MSNLSHQPIDPELLIRFLSGEASAQERHEVNQWIEADEHNRNYFEELSLLWKASGEAGNFNSTFLMHDWKKIEQKIVFPKVGLSHEPRGKERNLIFYLSRIAAAILLLVLSYFFTENVYTQWSMEEIVVASGAGKTSVTLPDGSVVSLNSNSKLVYPRKFIEGTRKVTVDGEAFFDVTKDLQKPFIIKTGEVFTKVVGTSFSINTHLNQVVVTVVTGKVLLYKDSSEVIAMTKGQQGLYTINGLEKRDNRDSNFLSWKTNVLTFRNTPFVQVINDLNRHFGVSIVVAPNSLEGCALTSTFQNQSLEEIINELKIIFSIETERRNGIVLVSGKGCK